jgi:hypothetical protein
VKAVLLPKTRWVCVSCDFQHESYQTPMHPCAGLRGLMTTMVPEGTGGKHVIREREDYINGEDVQYHEGRPVMAVETHRNDGMDATVYAPRAVGD